MNKKVNGLKRRINRTIKNNFHPIIYSNNKNKVVLFIFGSGRSGTTLFTDIFEKDFRAIVFREASKITYRAGEYRLRLKPFDVVKKTL